MAMPAASAAAMHSASFLDPPGSTTYWIPNAAAASMLSGNGKKASETSTVWARTCAGSRPRRATFSRAFSMASLRMESTRLGWPAPMPRTACCPGAHSHASRIALDLRCLQIRMPKSASGRRASGIAAFVTGCQASGAFRSASCVSVPPLIRRVSLRASGAAKGRSSEISRMSLDLAFRNSRASGSNAGAMSASTNRPLSTCAVARSTGRVTAMTEPNDETTSPSQAAASASASVAPVAAPQGLVCLMMTAAGHACSSRAASSAASPST